MLTAGFSSFRGNPSWQENDRLIPFAPSSQEALDADFAMGKRRRTTTSSRFPHAGDADPLAPTPLAKMARTVMEPSDGTTDTDTSGVPNSWAAPTLIDCSSLPPYGRVSSSSHQEMPITSAEDDPLPPTPNAIQSRAEEAASVRRLRDSPRGPNIQASGREVTSPDPSSSCCYDADTEDQVEHWVSYDDLESLQRTVGMESQPQIVGYPATTTRKSSTAGAGKSPNSSRTWYGETMDSCTTESDCEVLELLEDIITTAPCSSTVATSSPWELMAAISTAGSFPYTFSPRTTTSNGHPTKHVGEGPEMNDKGHSITVNTIGRPQHQHHDHPLLHSNQQKAIDTTTILQQAPPTLSNLQRLRRQRHYSDSLTTRPTLTFNCMDVLMNSRGVDRPT
jgi:hypothetical protein